MAIVCLYFTAIDAKNESLLTNVNEDTKRGLLIVHFDLSLLETKEKSIL